MYRERDPERELARSLVKTVGLQNALHLATRNHWRRVADHIREDAGRELALVPRQSNPVRLH